MTLLILREEIVCAVMIAFIICYTAIYKIKNNSNSFMRVLVTAFCHVILDITTVITVNNRDVVPEFTNKFLHLLFYFFSIAFTMEFFDYIVLLTMPHNIKNKIRPWRFFPVIVFVISFFILPIEYRIGNGTDYSYGPLTFLGYGLFVLYCMACLILVIRFRNKIDFKIRITLLPMFFFMILVVILQAIIPELLMTSAGITFVCLGLFASFNNPAQEYKEQAYWDAATGIKNKNGYQKQLQEMERKYTKKKIRVGFLIGDMNGLKKINDTYGHAEGDKLIRAAANVLTNQLTSAYDIYRIGGDEFVAIYLSPNDEAIEKEIAAVNTACEAYKESPISLSIALGYASGEYSANYMDIYNQADSIMYENKQKMKAQHPELCGR